MAPKSLLSLGEILEEYITLKEHKVSVDQERCRLEQENLRVQNLLKGMQNVMNLYNAGVVTPPPLSQPPPNAVASREIVSQSEVAVQAPAGYLPTRSSAEMTSAPKPSDGGLEPAKFSTPVISHINTKRQGPKDASNCNVAFKRSRRCTLQKEINLVTEARNAGIDQDKSLINSQSQSHVCDNVPNGSAMQGSNIVKCLFTQKVQSPANSSIPKTPPQSSSSQPDKCNSTLQICSAAASTQDFTPQQVISDNCTIISSETIRVTPTKQIGYYSIEKNHCITTCSPVKTNLTKLSRKSHVKGKLEFGVSDMPMIPENQTPDGISASESDIEGNLLDLDFSNLDALGLDFNFSEFLVDYDIEGEGLSISSQQMTNSSPDSQSGSPHTSENVNMGAKQARLHLSSTVPQMFGEKDMNLVGSDSVAAMCSVTKCIRIISPVKNQSSLDQDNTCGRT